MGAARPPLATERPLLASGRRRAGLVQAPLLHSKGPLETPLEIQQAGRHRSREIAQAGGHLHLLHWVPCLSHSRYVLNADLAPLSSQTDDSPQLVLRQWRCVACEEQGPSLCAPHAAKTCFLVQTVAGAPSDLCKSLAAAQSHKTQQVENRSWVALVGRARYALGMQRTRPANTAKRTVHMPKCWRRPHRRRDQHQH